MPGGESISALSKDYHQFEKTVLDFVLGKLNDKQHTKKWIAAVLLKYENENGKLPPPQLAAASYLLAGGCAHLLYKLALNLPVRKFPEFYLFGLEDSL